VTAATTINSQPALARLDWECDHFQLEAAQLGCADLDDAALAEALRAARRGGVRLVVWPAPVGRDVSGELLSECGGTLVDRKATFSRPLEPLDEADQSGLHAELRVIPYASTTVSPDLFELALAAGVYSRFNVDPHFSLEEFAAMYQVWIERSVSGQLADAVLVIPLDHPPRANEQRLGGMVTVSESNGAASVGLIAVAPALRGRGAGTELLRAAHRWMRSRCAREVQVVTQLANLPACRLYERSGYRLSRVQHYYHFWL
jgi:dTDP-4-amino-4,6-dideoxy-D-galactose acyltransferase